MFLSIITVTYNAENHIRQTLDSIQSQLFTDYELIIVDGKSTDDTIYYAKQYESIIPNLLIISEPDKGIYDAMNKGVSIAKGEYIYFLNAGDELYSDDTLVNICKRITDLGIKRNVIFQGGVIKNGRVLEFPKSYSKWKWIYLEHAYFCHQGIFASADTLKNNRFDITLRVCADRDWLIRVMDKSGTYVYMSGIIVAKYLGGGISSGYSSQQADQLVISKRYGGMKAWIFVKIKREIGRVLGHPRD